MSFRSVSLGLVVILSLVALPATSPAFAHDTSQLDPDDIDSPLDIEEVVHSHWTEHLRIEVVSYGDWVPENLSGQRIVVHINTDHDATTERRGVLEYDPDRRSGLRFEIINSHGEKVERGRARQVSDSAFLGLTRDALGDARRYTTFVTLEIRDQQDCSEVCIDRVPDEGVTSHRLRRLCYGGEPTIVGSDGDDVLTGTPDQDVIDARGGDDDISEVAVGDRVCGRGGDDVISGLAGLDLWLHGGRGADVITASAQEFAGCDDTGEASCILPIATLVGGRGDDELHGGNHHEYLYGQRGDDLLRGYLRSDLLDGGGGNDTLLGGGGDDSCAHGERVFSCEHDAYRTSRP